MRLGFVGCGRWGQKLATAFRECGAEIVVHQRSVRVPKEKGLAQLDPSVKWPEWAPGFGKPLNWEDQIASKSIDAIIAVATPEVTTEVAMACAAAGKPVMATKPLFDHPASIRAPFYIDAFRLWSVAHRSFLEHGSEADQVAYHLCGGGPFRDFPGAFDYGPHVMMALLDAGFDPDEDHFEGHREPCERGELFVYEASIGGRGDITLLFGNGAKSPERIIWNEVETATRIGHELKQDATLAMCRDFMADVSEGFADPRLLNLSRDGMALLRRAREAAQ